MKRAAKALLTGVVLFAALGVVLLKYRQYVTHPWTRDGQVQADVIQIAPRVTGPIVDLPVADNQFVKAGEVLFEIDPRTFAASLEQARAQLDEARDKAAALEKKIDAAEAAVDVSRAAVKVAEVAVAATQSEIAKTNAEYERQKAMLPEGATSQKSLERAKASYEVNLDKKISAEASLLEAQASLIQSQATLAQVQADLGEPGDNNATVRAALAAVHQAELNLEFTRVTAPVDGYVTNLHLRPGSQAVANQPLLALVDVNSYYVYGFFRENCIADMEPGDRAVVTLMTYPGRPLEGRIESLGWGIARDDGSTSHDLLPEINPTFEWIRLAQRVPVNIQLIDVPDDIKLRVGTTASVLVFAGQDTAQSGGPATAAPGLLQ